MMTTGEKIAALRRGAGWSQEALADRLGLSRQAVSKWEADQAVPGMDNLVELAKLFGVSVDTLLRPGEPFPGKDPARQGNKEPAEDAATEGISPVFRPQSTKMTKWFPMLLALLFSVCAVCSVASLIWVARLQDRVDSLPLGGGTVYLPSGEPQTSGDIAGFTDEVQYDAAAGRLRFSFTIMPGERDEAETAQIMIKSGAATEMAAAEWADGAYSATVLMPLEDHYQVFLLLTKDGKTRSLPVNEYFDMRVQYTLTMQGMEADGGARQAGRIGPSTFTLSLGLPDGGGNYPVRGTVTLYAGEAALGTAALDNMGRQSDLADATSVTVYCRATFPSYDLPEDARNLRFAVTVEDAYGVQTGDEYDWQKW